MKLLSRKISWIGILILVLIVFSVVVLTFAPAEFEWAERLAKLCLTIASGKGLSIIAGYIFNHYDTHENSRNLPLRGVLNVSRGIIWAVVTIISVSILIDRSPAYLLTGLGAFAAALMLVFKDSILGFVAGIQMSQNDMLHVGDWIVVPSTGANGIVEYVSLTVVRVRNFDNTFVTVPPYTLVSTSFQNYRGMLESCARRFMRTLIIDLPTISKSTPEMLEKHPELSAENTETNLGLFRSYAIDYLRKSPLIDASQIILVRILDPTPNGVPVQIYAFAATTDWATFESIQSQITEHFITALPEFNLALYTSSSLSVQAENKS